MEINQKTKKFDLSAVRYSRIDKLKRVRVPEKLDESLAEDIGIHVGDGCLFKHKGTNPRYEFLYSGNVSEKEYMEHIIKLKEMLYNVSRIRKYVYGNEMRFTFNSLAIATFYSKVLGLPIGKKRHIDIPEIIKNSDNINIKIAFIRGLIDTDFGLILRNTRWGKYPSLVGVSISKNLIISVSKILSELRIPPCVEFDIKNYDKRTNKFYPQSRISLNGFKRVGLWLRIIRFNNKAKYKKRVGLMGFEPTTSGYPKPGV